MKQVKVYIELAEFGYSAYMQEAGLDYGCTGEGATVEEAIDDFKKSYEGIREYYERHGKRFEEVDYSFYYDTASFLEEYSKAFSLAGLERITGVSQANWDTSFTAVESHRPALLLKYRPAWSDLPEI